MHPDSYSPRQVFSLQLVRHKDTPRAKDSTPWLLSPLFGMACLAFCYCMIHLLLSAFYLIFTVKTLQQLQDGNATTATGRAVLSCGAVRPISWHLTNLLCKFMFVPLCLASIPTLMLSLCACSFGHSAEKWHFFLYEPTYLPSQPLTSLSSRWMWLHLIFSSAALCAPSQSRDASLLLTAGYLAGYCSWPYCRVESLLVLLSFQLCKK